MVLETKIVALALCAILAALIFELVRKRRIREEYSLLWFAVTLVFALLVVFDRVALRVIHLLGGTNISSLFFLAGVLFAVLMLIHLTVRISALTRTQNVLIQEVGLARERLERLGVTGASEGPTEEIQQ